MRKFKFAQSNRIADCILRRYGTEPEFLWAQYPGCGVFRKTENEKWFGIIMNVDLSRVAPDGSGEVEVLNVKLGDEAWDYIGRPGIYPAYHMSKKSWVSIVLDDTLEDEAVLTLVEKSRELVSGAAEKIYEAVKRIPRGCVATYAQVAAAAGNPKMARAVGNALHKNPKPGEIPCHRVVNAKGQLAEAFVFGGPGRQAELLRAEGVEATDGKVDLGKYGCELTNE